MTRYSVALPLAMHTGAALTSLLEADEREPPAALEVIRAGLVKYGRKPKR